MNCSFIEIFHNFSNGYIVEFAPVNESGYFTSAYCISWILLPAENLWPAWLRAILYIIGLMFCFIGVAIGSDVFMTSIEVITSKKRTIVMVDKETKIPVPREVFIWNETVANLTLLALGSSAPEILLAVVETVNDLITSPLTPGSSLGFYTIIGSAAFNLLLITGICIVSIPSPESKKVEQFGVFILTAISSLLAYVWLLVVLLWNTEDVVDPWEAWVTFLSFPILVLTAYATDNGWWKEKWLMVLLVKFRIMNAIKPTSNKNGIGQDSIADRAIPLSPEKRRRYHGVESISRNVDSNSNLQTTTPPSNRLQELRQPFARARFRHAAIRSLGGIRRMPVNLTLADVSANHTPKSQSKFSNVVSEMATVHGINNKSNLIHDQSNGTLSFAAPSYSVLESAGILKIDVMLNRRRRVKGQVIVPITDSEGRFDLKEMVGAISVDYETREGSAKINKDFKYSTGTLVFTEDIFTKVIEVPIINDNQYNPDTDFYVILKNPTGGAVLGDPSVTRITIIDDDKPGDFVLEKSQLYADAETGFITARVLRENGCDGNVFVRYSTIDGTAIGGLQDDENADYTRSSGTLQFKHQEGSKLISVPINPNNKEVKNFVIVLRNPSQGSNLGEHSAAVANINLQPGGVNNLSRVLIEEENTSWSGQFVRAMQVGGEVDEKGNEAPPSGLAYFLHFISLPWKVLFAFTPTRNVLGGFPAFLVSMFFIGAITAIVEQLGNLLGCVTGLRQQVTGITIIAIGTSLPDTIASRTAALKDSTADAAIGNITGSNSVNVFLGLGLPWVIRVCYHLVNGGEYRVNTENLDFSVILFDCLGAVCIIGLIIRRFWFGGELGGKPRVKWFSGSFLLLLWFTFIIVIAIRVQTSDNATGCL